MNDVILAVDAGSSSVKFGVYALPASRDGELARLVHGQIEGIGVAPRFSAVGADGETLARDDVASAAAPFDHEAALSHILAPADRHRRHPCARRAPARRAADRLFRHGVPSNATCRGAALFGLPTELSGEGIRRYGFHGLSYQYIASQLPKHLGTDSDGRVIVAHLGNGASLCALRGRRSVASTMGFTALDGLLMGTRCGSLDPGVVLYLIEHKRMAPAQVAELLYERSGLLGVSGLSSDLRVLLASDKPAAAQAIDLFVYRIVRELGSLVAALGRLDALVFTAGIGENSAQIRQRVCEQFGWLRLKLDRAANEVHGPRISTADSPVSAWVIATNEE